jgi:hypothetical protein
MKIKSLLLGSAAALVAVSGARAADAVVVAEPEPMEYVRVCDVYGSGFYYMPGTETCLKVSGYVRVDIRGGDLFAEVSNSGDDTYDNRARFQLRVDARSETELGTLRSYAAVDFQYEGSQNQAVTDVGDQNGDGVNDVVLTNVYDNEDTFGWEHIYIELGGFRIGKTDSLFSTFTDYSSGVLNDGLVPYGPFATLQIAYTYTGPNGFSAALAVEQGDEDEGGITEDYAPFVAGGVSLTQGWGKIGVVAGWDTWQEEVAVKARLDFNVTETATVFVMGAWDSGGDQFEDADNTGENFYAPWGGDWAIWAGTAIKFNEKATFNAEVGYDDFDDFSVAANIAYELVPGFTITPEIDYTDNFDDNPEGDFTTDAFGFDIRFQRNF